MSCQNAATNSLKFIVVVIANFKFTNTKCIEGVVKK